MSNDLNYDTSKYYTIQTFMAATFNKKMLLSNILTAFFLNFFRNRKNSQTFNLKTEMPTHSERNEPKDKSKTGLYINRTVLHLSISCTEQRRKEKEP